MGDVASCMVTMEQRMSAGGLCASFFHESLRYASAPEQSLTITLRVGWYGGGAVLVVVGGRWEVSCHVVLVRVGTSRSVVVVFRRRVFGLLLSSHWHVVVGRCRVVVLTFFFFVCGHVVLTSSRRCRHVVILWCRVVVMLLVCSGMCVARRCSVQHKAQEANASTGATLRENNKPG